MSPYVPLKCNFSCDNEDSIFSADCGGDKAQNVYISDQDYDFDNNKRCMSLQCSLGSPMYRLQPCAEYLNKICQNANASIGNAHYWNISMKFCKNSTFSSYLLGNLDLTNASGSCQTLPTGNAVRWIGIARQEYTYEDQGWAIEEKEEQYFQLCQRCLRNGTCNFSHCYDTIRTKVYCSNKMTTEITDTRDVFTTKIISTSQSTSKKQTTMVTRTTPFMENQTTPQKTLSTLITTQSHPQRTTNNGSISTMIQQHTVETSPISISENPEGPNNEQHMIDDGDTVNSLIPIILGIVFPVMAIVLLVIYIRRRHMKKRSKGRGKKLPETERDNKTHTEDNNPSYFVIEKSSSYELADSSKLNSESPYSETKEGDYDHLRNKDSRKKDVDETYQHATHGTNEDISNYESTKRNEKQGLRYTGQMMKGSKNRKARQLERVDGTYSEVDNPPQSAYFVLEKPSSYEVVDNSVIDSESPYNETEEGDYDHLRNKDSRKKDVDDMYQHATHFTNGDISHYNTSTSDQRQEPENTYDHMHDSQNKNRDSDYGHNSIDLCIRNI